MVCEVPEGAAGKTFTKQTIMVAKCMLMPYMSLSKQEFQTTVKMSEWMQAGLVPILNN